MKKLVVVGLIIVALLVGYYVGTEQSNASNEMPVQLDHDYDDGYSAGRIDGYNMCYEQFHIEDAVAICWTDYSNLELVCDFRLDTDRNFTELPVENVISMLEWYKLKKDNGWC